MSDLHGVPPHPGPHPGTTPHSGPASYSNPPSDGRLTFPWQPPPPPAPPRPHRRATPPPGQHSDLRLLRTAYRRLRRVATLTALGYFTLFLVLSAYAPSLMTRTWLGGMSAGLLLMFWQLPVTCLALLVYEAYARGRVDPLARRLRRQAAAEAEDAP
ncbi:hypothetical protein DSC45_19275 [Streptomyces sp. YIM 130001]|uniref:DUF485 domain-containing protein n=1 Tax=Streptomyces sp. YIM 130001 TaxID=2259644 RepID=UPI000E64A004|nr:DUF485 domain-containing protein [Streptomyces sp. YIM 130001]RII15039.1 hypothetical protein DSC45_19275 [Streptomyces sp. YIM 130001]